MSVIYADTQQQDLGMKARRNTSLSNKVTWKNIWQALNEWMNNLHWTACVWEGLEPTLTECIPKVFYSRGFCILTWKYPFSLPTNKLWQLYLPAVTCRINVVHVLLNTDCEVDLFPLKQSAIYKGSLYKYLTLLTAVCLQSKRKYLTSFSLQ